MELTRNNQHAFMSLPSCGAVFLVVGFAQSVLGVAALLFCVLHGFAPVHWWLQVEARVLPEGSVILVPVLTVLSGVVGVLLLPLVGGLIAHRRVCRGGNQL